MQTCECKLWDKNIDQYNDMFNFVEKYHGPSYEGDDYSFCPWCGVDISEDEVEEEEEWEEDEEDDDEDEADTIRVTPWHEDEVEEEEEEDEEEGYDLEIEAEFEPEITSYPILLEGWVSPN